MKGEPGTMVIPQLRRIITCCEERTTGRVCPEHVSGTARAVDIVL